MNHVSAGFGLGIAAWPVVDRLVPNANPSALIALGLLTPRELNGLGWLNAGR